jgi:hypothetical protein
MIDARLSDWSPKELAAHALVTLCWRDGSPGDGAICLGVVEFLETATGLRQSDTNARQQRLKDCLNVVKSPGTYEQCLAWVKSWFG